MSPPYRSYALISKARIAANYREVCRAVGPGVQVLGVVKADAYGHGSVEVSRVLVAEGAKWLAVSSVDEGVTLRLGGIETRILVMGGFLKYEGEALAQYDLTPAVHSLDDIAAIDLVAQARGKPLPYHLKIDSGMSRMGMGATGGEIAAAVRAARHARLEGLMTHFASAADYDSPQTEQQAAQFYSIARALEAEGIRPELVHMSSTNAIGYGRRETWHNMVRAGLAIYGYLSPAYGAAPPGILNIEPALTWKARILTVKEIPEGALVGYGASFRAPGPMRIAVLGAGYADGVFYSLSNRGKAIAAGKLTPMLGTISMDLTIIDISHTNALGTGDEVTLLGREGEVRQDAQEIARIAGTISYNILCAISARVRRVYI